MIDPRELTERVILKGEEWADKDAAASALEESKKSVFAQAVAAAMEDAIKAGLKPLSVAMAESRAYLSESDKAHVLQMVEARRVANRARVVYDMGRVELDLLRSHMATTRAEMGMTR